jgi:hypothetical protein
MAALNLLSQFELCLLQCSRLRAEAATSTSQQMVGTSSSVQAYRRLWKCNVQQRGKVAAILYIPGGMRASPATCKGGKTCMSPENLYVAGGVIEL